MIVYNVTIKVAQEIQQDWLTWLKTEHIPEVINTGCFTGARTLQLLEIDDSDGATFAIQYTADTKSLYEQYINEFAESMRKKSFDKWGNKFIAFRSVMEVVH